MSAKVEEKAIEEAPAKVKEKIKEEVWVEEKAQLKVEIKIKKEVRVEEKVMGEVQAKTEDKTGAIAKEKAKEEDQKNNRVKVIINLQTKVCIKIKTKKKLFEEHKQWLGQSNRATDTVKVSREKQDYQKETAEWRLEACQRKKWTIDQSQKQKK